ncbi:MAG: hypothetical protein HYT20_02925 [Candidatus Nealsonbacteria bacterium]|nr:hypothetical protein [Candidatus Nealsonbacteria bacterium]
MKRTMGIGKYKYYFKKPKSEIVKDIFRGLAITGAISVAVTSPYFIQNLLYSRKKFKKYPKQRVSSTFDRLRREGLILIQKRNSQIYISLTAEGRKKAGMFQIDALNIKRNKKWDGKWRLLSFDIPEKRKIVREALRGKLKELGFCPFQKSIWIYPYNCVPEIELLKTFFGLPDREAQLIVAENINQNDDWKKVFNLSR